MYIHVLLLCYTCTITHAKKQAGGNQGEGSPNACETADGSGIENISTFSIEEELRYATRFEEGFNIPDPKYEAWLRLNHPNVDSSNPSVSIPQTTPTNSSASFSSSSSSQPMPSTSQAPTKPTVPHKPPSATPSRSDQVSKNKRSPLSDLLNLPAQPNVKAKTIKTGKARVLTSSECLRILLEKEEEKKKVAQEKERRRQERELKKKQNEEEQKRKAEEKVRKAAEREAAKALKEAAKADREAAKLAEREKKELQKSQKSGQKRQAVAVATTTRPKRNKLKENVDVSINADLCCVCFGSYQEDVGTGREWLQCSCSRWIHEDCVDDEDVEEDSGRLCPLC